MANPAQLDEKGLLKIWLVLHSLMNRAVVEIWLVLHSLINKAVVEI